MSENHYLYKKIKRLMEFDMTKGNLNALTSDIKRMIEQSRNHVVVQVNSQATILYWNIGKRIRKEVLKGQRAEYGKCVLSELGKELTATFGRGWGEQQLRHCLRCAEVFSDEKILYTLCIELSWSHISYTIPYFSPEKFGGIELKPYLRDNKFRHASSMMRIRAELLLYISYGKTRRNHSVSAGQ